jgi:nitrite reductase (NAD(P)H)
VFVYRNISDLDAIIEYAARDEVKHAVVVGGGLLGLEAAKAVYDLETSVFYAFIQLTEGLTVFRNRIEHVSIINNRQAYPLSRQLDADAGEMVLLKIEAMGVHVFTNCSPVDQLTHPANDGSDNKVSTGFRAASVPPVRVCSIDGSDFLLNL